MQVKKTSGQMVNTRIKIALGQARVLLRKHDLGKGEVIIQKGPVHSNACKSHDKDR